MNRTGAHSNTSNINNILRNDHIIRIKKLENELVEARMKNCVSYNIKVNKMNKIINIYYVNLGIDNRKPFIKDVRKTT